MNKMYSIDSNTIFHNPTNGGVYTICPGKKPIRILIVCDSYTQDTTLDFCFIANSPNCFAEIRLLSRSVQCSVALNCTLVIKKGAIDSSLNYLHTAIMSDGAQSVQSSPKIIIQEDQVKCTHGATLSGYSSVSLEYLATRGIARQDAQNMLYLSQYTVLCEWASMK